MSNKTNIVDKAVSACFCEYLYIRIFLCNICHLMYTYLLNSFLVFEVNEYECPMQKRKGTYNITIKPVKNLITSYGGTFPVSKEQTPLPSPKSRPKNSDFSR